MRVNSLILSMSLLLSPFIVYAHGDEDHSTPTSGNMAVASVGEKPQRLPDGRVFMPKDTQRKLELRTLVSSESRVAQTLELNGHVVMDPNTSGLVQPLQAGRLQAGPNGLPTLGQRVKKGDVLAQVIPSVSAIDLANQQTQIADWQVRVQLAQKELARLQSLANSVPRKDIDAAKSEVAALHAQMKALKKGVTQAELLLSPVDGVIASATAINGQVVESKEVLFEIIDPQRLMVEAFAYDPQIAARIVSANIQGESGDLSFIGSGKALREGSIPLLFRSNNATDLVLGQPVKLIAQTNQSVTGTVLPISAIVKNAANEPIVWLHEAPESFQAESVQVQPLNSDQVVVSGLKPLQRVVVKGVTLLNQIR
jgi:membrane fusion protein, heavy metal efflux system